MVVIYHQICGLLHGRAGRDSSLTSRTMAKGGEHLCGGAAYDVWVYAATSQIDV